MRGARGDGVRSVAEGLRSSTLAAVTAAVLLAIATAYVDVGVANRKLFWADEENAQAQTCAQSYHDLIARGAYAQCSPEPLYYILEKVYLKRLPTNDNILWTHRLISLLSAAGCVAVIVAVAARTLGLTAALAAALVLLSETLFHRFAAENRPYMLWTFAFTTTVLCAAWLSTERARARPRTAWSAFAISAGILTMTANPGVLQSAGALGMVCAIELLRLRAGRCSRASAAATVLRATAVAAVLAALAYRYITRPCPVPAHPYDVLGPNQTSLVLDVLQVAWPSGWTGLAGNLLALAGIAATLRALLRLAQSGEADWRAALGAQVLAQVAAALAVAAAIAYQHYFFGQRMFIYLTVCRALLAALGAHFVLASIVLPRAGVARAKVAAVTAGVVAVALVFRLRSTEAVLARDYSDPPAEPSPARCERFQARLHLWQTTHLDHWEVPNLIVRFSRVARGCGDFGRGPDRHVRIDPDLAPDWYRIDDDPPGAGFEPMKQCGLEVVVTR